MPLYTGSTRDQRPADRPYLSVIVFGTATDGVLSETRWFSDAEQAAFAYGGNTVARLSPSANDTTATLNTSFVPDDPTLSLDARRKLYHCDPVTGKPVRYRGLGRMVASDRPTVMTFDRIGSDPSVAIYDGGLFLEAPGYASHALNGDLLLPLMSAINETGPGTDDVLVNVGGCRVGSSWLPSAPASMEIVVSGTAAVSGAPSTGTYELSCVGQGDASTSDPYLAVRAVVRPDALVIDPGRLGLPYTRHTYPFASYATWNDLWDNVQNDFQAGVQPMRLTGRPLRTSSVAMSVPVSSGTASVSASYPDAAVLPPDLTTALGWFMVLSEEDLPLDECPFLVFSGLTGQALAADPDNAINLLTLIDQNANGSDENPDLLVIVPWSLTPPVLGDPYDGTQDADAMFNLADAIGPQLASRLLVVWGGMTQTGMPPGLDGNPLQIPVAYAASGAMVREAADTDPAANLLHPQIQTVITSYIPPLLIQTSSEAPSPALPTSVPSPDALETLRVSGLSALTRSVGDRWCLYSPILLGSRDPLRIVLCEAVLRERIQRALDPFLGESNNAKTRSAISAALSGVVSDVARNADTISRQISDLALELLPNSAQETQLVASLAVEGRATIYGEISVLTFQASLRG